jgi:hypothetical protein
VLADPGGFLADSLRIVALVVKGEGDFTDPGLEEPSIRQGHGLKGDGHQTPSEQRSPKGAGVAPTSSSANGEDIVSNITLEWLFEVLSDEVAAMTFSLALFFEVRVAVRVVVRTWSPSR